MDKKKIDRMTVDGGRRAEVHTIEQSLDGGATQRVTEHYEEIVPLEKKKRVTEHIVPVVMERVTESYNGNLVDKTVERVAGSDLQLTFVKPHVTAEEIEAIVRRVVGPQPPAAIPVQPVPVYHPPVQQPQPVQQPVVQPVVAAAIPVQPVQPIVGQPAVSFDDNPTIAYALIVLLAIELGFMVWQLFIR